MRESGDEKSTLRQIEKIKALSEDMLEYQAIDVYKRQVVLSGKPL